MSGEARKLQGEIVYKKGKGAWKPFHMSYKLKQNKVKICYYVYLGMGSVVGSGQETRKWDRERGFKAVDVG